MVGRGQIATVVVPSPTWVVVQFPLAPDRGEASADLAPHHDGHWLCDIFVSGLQLIFGIRKGKAFRVAGFDNLRSWQSKGFWQSLWRWARTHRVSRGECCCC